MGIKHIVCGLKLACTGVPSSTVVLLNLIRPTQGMACHTSGLQIFSLNSPHPSTPDPAAAPVSLGPVVPAVQILEQLERALCGVQSGCAVRGGHPSWTAPVPIHALHTAPASSGPGHMLHAV